MVTEKKGRRAAGTAVCVAVVESVGAEEVKSVVAAAVESVMTAMA